MSRPSEMGEASPQRSEEKESEDSMTKQTCLEMDQDSLQRIEEKQSKGFRWLSRNARGPTYISYSQFAHLQACSFDWGADGYAGCCNHGGELLYLSAPSPRFGLVMARGNFSTTLYASLSRAQIEFGGPATFGLEISRAEFVYGSSAADKDDKSSKKASSFKLGSMIDRGCYNYRWPVTEYHLDEKTADDDAEENHVGTCQMFSCAKDGIFYQVLRIEEGVSFDKEGKPQPKFPDIDGVSQVVLTMGGPVYFHSFEERLVDHNVVDELEEKEKVEDISVDPEIKKTPKLPGICKELRYWNGHEELQIGLEAKVYQLHPNQQCEQLWMTESDSDADSGTKDTRDQFKTPAYNLTVSLPKPDEGTRTAIFLAAIRLYEKDRKGGGAWPQLPSSEELYNYVGIQPSSKKATGAMWESIFIERRNQSDSVFDLAEVNLIGRSLEKVLQVDIVPAIFTENPGDPPNKSPAEEDTAKEDTAKKDTANVGTAEKDKTTKDAEEEDKEASPTTPETALVSNLFLKQNVDLKSLFWKVRFLIRTFKFLSHLTEPSKPAPSQREKASAGSRAAEQLGSPDQASPGSEIPQQSGPDQVVEAIPDTTSTGCSNNGSPHLDFPETDLKDMLVIAKFQQKRIRKHIESIVRYLVRALLKPDSSTHLMPDNHVAGEANYFYVMTTIWYVTRHFPNWTWDWKESIKDEKCKKAKSHLYYNGNRLPPDDWTFGTSDKDKVPLLQWYHHGSILNLCEQRILPETWKEDGLQWKVLRLAKEAKIVSAAKLASLRPYTADDEIFDRLCFLSDELGLEHLSGEKRIGAVTSLAMKRIKQRDNTRELNPGWVRRPEDGSTSGPWEIHALCHHSRLVVTALEETDSQDWRTKQHTIDEIESYKRKIYRFLNAESTLVPSWERAHEKARKGWLRSEATAVLASTLLYMHEKAMKDEERSREEKRMEENENDKDTTQSGVVMAQRTKKEVHQDQRKLLMEIIYMESLMSDQLDVFGKFTDEAARLPPVKWVTFAPSRRHHPDSFFNSLEDTPELYRPTELKKVFIPAALTVGQYATAPQDMGCITKANLNSVVKPNRLFISDITANVPSQATDSLKKHILDWSYPRYDAATKRKMAESDDDKKKLVWHLYDSLADQEVQHRFLTVRNPPDPEDLSPSQSPNLEHKTTLQPKKTLRQVLGLPKIQLHDESLKKGKKKSRNLPKEVIDLLIYVIHIESAPCLANHVLRFSQFSCQNRDTWVACITLRSWRIDSNGKKPAGKKTEKEALPDGEGNALQKDTSNTTSEIMADEKNGIKQTVTTRKREGIRWRNKRDQHAPPTAGKAVPKDHNDSKSVEETATADDAETVDESTDTPDDDPITLPDNLKEVWEGSGVDENLTFELEISSIVISTNAFGDFSKCTIISELLDEGEMKDSVELARELWTKFIHQPQTARCLVFLLVLGKMCQKISAHYEAAVKKLNPILQNLDVIFTREEKAWNNNKNSPKEFEFGLWSLDALSKLQTSLKFSVDSLLQAKEELMAQIQNGPGKRSIVLERMCEGYLRDFESSLVQVTSMNAKLERRIELNTRYKEAFSAVLAMRDSRTSLSQNSTVQRLTYLTIGYLPMGLMATIFAIPQDQKVIFGHMGISWFVGAIMILSAATFTFAWFIGDILEFWKFSRFMDVPKKIWEWVCNVFRFCFGPRKRNAEGSLPRYS